jgi:hypothetical protein
MAATTILLGKKSTADVLRNGITQRHARFNDPIADEIGGPRQKKALKP